MDIIDTLSVTASGLTAQRVRMQTVAANMANARTTRTADGGPYRRRMPVFESAPVDPFGNELDMAMERVNVTEIAESDEPFVRVFDPGHPDADGDGYVEFPNVNILEEMVDMMMTARTYEANSNVVTVTKSMAQTAIDISR
jgi:flagellar basal-body rod protein FlgC